VKRRRKKLTNIFMLCVPSSHDNTKQSKQQQKSAQNMLKLQLERVWFRLWQKRALEQRQMLRKRARKVYKRYIVTVLTQWLIQSKIIKEEKRKFKQIVMKLKHGKTIRILQAWLVVTGEMRDLRRALVCFTMMSQKKIIVQWKKMIVEIKYGRYLETRGDIHYIKRLRKLHVKIWYKWMLEQKKQQKMLLKALRLMRNRLLVQTIEIW
jgi:hypothetical protein